jgi:hypothetical protein
MRPAAGGHQRTPRPEFLTHGRHGGRNGIAGARTGKKSLSIMRAGARATPAPGRAIALASRAAAPWSSTAVLGERLQSSKLDCLTGGPDRVGYPFLSSIAENAFGNADAGKMIMNNIHWQAGLR